MKFLIVLTLMAASFTATAARKTRVITEAPTAQFYFNKQIRFINLTNVCLDGDNLQTLKEYSVCLEYKMKRDRNGRLKPSTDCKVSDKRILTTNIEYKRRKCVDYNRRNGRRKCAKYEDVYYTYPTTFTKTVRKQRWIGNSNNGSWGYPGVVLSKGKFTIPNCQ